MDRLVERVIVITGSTGIAAAAAESAASEGAAVFVISRDPAHAGDLAERVGGAWAAADLADERAVDAAIDAAVVRFGRIDGLFAVAGGSGRRFGDGPIHDLTLEGWERTLSLNLTTQALTARGVIRVMRAQDPIGRAPGGRGSIVLVSSVLASRPVPELFATHAYAAAKGAIISLATTMAAAYAPERIRVNVIAPSLTATAMAQRAAGDSATIDFARRKQPLVDGFLDAADIAPGAIYLLGEESRAVTGQVLTIDGGWSLSATPAGMGSGAAAGPEPTA